jgi:DNA-binding MarR family transcriptional regulator
MDAQDQLVTEGLALYRELVRMALAAKFHHPHSPYFSPEDCPADATPEEMAAAVEARRESIPEGQIKLLVHLSAHGPQTMSEVADGLQVTTPAITGLVDKLEKRGMLERVRDQEDRRVVRVRLVPRAQQMAEAHVAERRRQMRAVLETLSPEEQQRFIKTLRLMVQTFHPKPTQETELLSK